jgi:uncharacterized protein YecE (DUF72 family)
MTAFIGTAGWSIPRAQAASFGTEGSALQRYASRFDAVEINSSFHRPHRPATWARWAESVPPHFRFSVKVRKTITHERKLMDCGDILTSFLDEVQPLGSKLAILLVQLPPKLAFDAGLAADFFGLLASLTSVRVVCEPRHPSWFEPPAEDLLRFHRIARVAADPAPVPTASLPGGWPGLRYWRLHGSPQVYRSAYGNSRLPAYADFITHEAEQGREVWCIFDNTASSAAASDALCLQRLCGCPAV